MTEPKHSRRLASHPRAGCFLVVLILAGLLATSAAAQTLTTRHSFTETYTNSDGAYTNSDGANPAAALILSGNTLYGTAYDAGTNGNGTVFAITTNGTNFTVLHSFTATSTNSAGAYTNRDGANSVVGLVLSGNTLYGTAFSGGTNGNGTVFAVNTNGTGFTNLHSFTTTYTNRVGAYTNRDGANPAAGLILLGGALYGTAWEGGTNGNGTVFAVSTNGTGFTNLHSFTATDPNTGTNSDGANPPAGLILSGNTLYGTAKYGGTNGNGTVFAVNTNGTGFTNLHSFTALNNYTNSDGANPYAGLILSGSTLYGTAGQGGSNGYGTVFAVNTNGTGFTNLHSFTAIDPNTSTNSDGANPYAGLILSGNTLYGTAFYGGTNGNGAVFAVNTNSTGFTNLHSFNSYSSEGASPEAGLIIAGNTLYGTTDNGGGFANNGTVFSLSYPSPELTITRSGTNVNMTWPNGVAGYSYSAFTLQSTPNLVSAAVWSTVSPAPVVVNGRNAVTNSISGARQFYRLSK